ncbi:chloride channel protein [Bacteroidia bacterium]|nr:chloride channel protein [Bacteroidia bacterium]
MALGLVIGLLCGLAAGLLKLAIHFVQSHLVGAGESWFYLAYPALGMLLTALFVKYTVRDNISHGVTRVLYAISRKESKLPRHHTWTSIIASTLTIGLGGSVGAEAPIVLTGSAIGSNIGRYLRLNYKSITLLLACGAAGAVSGIFKAPIAGVIFTLEVLMIDITLTSVVPLLLSSVAATFVSYLLVGQNLEFAATSLQSFDMGNLPYYVLLGIFCGLLGLYFIRTTFFIEGQFAKIRRRSYRLLIGGTILALTIFLFPPLYGEGYGVITALLNNGSEQQVFQNSFLFQWLNGYGMLFVFLLLILIFKVVAMACTNGGGGVGGTFGPTLFMGGIGGFMVAKIINFVGIADLPIVNFTMVGMAGLMAAVMHSPLTAIFLIAEITGGYTLFVPLIVTSAVSYILINYFEPHSIYTKRLAQKGDLLTQNKDQVVLTLLRMQDFIEYDFNVLLVNGTLGDIVKIVSNTSRNAFPVVDNDNHLMGLVQLNDIRTDMFSVSKYKVFRVYDYMQSPPDVVLETDSMEKVVHKFEKSGAWNLPVVDTHNKYVGFVSKSKVLSAYREMLVKLNSE